MGCSSLEKILEKRLWKLLCLMKTYKFFNFITVDDKSSFSYLLVGGKFFSHKTLNLALSFEVVI